MAKKDDTSWVDKLHKDCVQGSEAEDKHPQPKDQKVFYAQTMPSQTTRTTHSFQQPVRRRRQILDLNFTHDPQDL